MQMILVSTPPKATAKTRMKLQQQQPLCCKFADNPMFSPSAAAMSRKCRVGPRPSRRFAVRLPMDACPGDYSSQCSLEIIRHALHEVRGEHNYEEESTSTSSSSNPLPSTTKRARFNLDLNNEIEADTTPLSDDEITQSWWRSHDYRASADLYNKDVQAFIANHEESVTELLGIVSQCNQSSCDELSENLKRSIFQSHLPRGAESDIAPVIKSLRSKHREAVMGYIHKIPKHLKTDLRERMLSARSIQYSRAHKMLARLLGEADALLACKQRQSES